MAQQKVNLRLTYIRYYGEVKGCRKTADFVISIRQLLFSFFIRIMFAIVSLKLICVVLLCLLVYVMRFHLFIYIFAEYDLQFLHQLPSNLLQDILNERYEQPALLDEDNVDEFLKVYDDFYGRNQPVTGRKKIPPTKPYVQMLMLYDVLKREAKRLMLNKFEVSGMFERRSFDCKFTSFICAAICLLVLSRCVNSNLQNVSRVFYFMLKCFEYRAIRRVCWPN